MSDKLEKALSEINTYRPDARDFIRSLKFKADEIKKINSMKRTEGWQMLQECIRNELHGRIGELIKNDSNVQVLMGLLRLTDTKSKAVLLDEEIDKFIPE